MLLCVCVCGYVYPLSTASFSQHVINAGFKYDPNDDYCCFLSSLSKELCRSITDCRSNYLSRAERSGKKKKKKKFTILAEFSVRSQLTAASALSSFN